MPLTDRAPWGSGHSPCDHMMMWAESDIREKREGVWILKRRTDTTMGAAERGMRDRTEAGEGAVETLHFRPRERLGECISDHVGTFAVDEAKQLVMHHPVSYTHLTLPTIYSV